MQTICPTSNRLREFLDGTVGDAEAQQISEHLAECPGCDGVLCGLEGEHGDVVNRLREGVRTDILLQEPEFEQLRNTVRFGAADTVAPPNFEEQLETGKRLRDYRLVKKIGEGGMGTVYQAFHVHLAKHVALKILPADKLTSAQSVKRFRQEMRAVGKVNHPNVVSASDAGTIDGQHFLVMELVQGADLARIIQDRGPLSMADACEIVRQAGIGLQHAHDNGLVHRDVKPSNIMLAIDGNVKLLDLGLAGLNNTEFVPTANVVVTDRLTSVGQIMGTLDYMAPEQITASPQVDGQADIYALGATLFQLLTGRTPCGNRSDSTPARIDAVLHKPPLDIATLRNDIPGELRGLLLKMLAKNPKDRPRTATDVAHALERFTFDANLLALAQACRTSLDMPSADVDVTNDVSFVVSRAAQPQRELPPPRRIPGFALASLSLCLVLLAGAYLVQTNEKTPAAATADAGSSEKMEAASAANGELAIAKKTLGIDGDVTAESLLVALNEGRLGYPLDQKYPEQEQPEDWGGPIHLRTSLRGEPGQEAFFSPVLDLLRFGSKSGDSDKLNTSLILEGLVDELSRGRGCRLETEIAATELAYHRGDLGAAKQRLINLHLSRTGSHRYVDTYDLSLWLVARYALAVEETAAIGRELADFSLSAAEALPDPRFKEVILRERGKLLKDDQRELAKAAVAQGDLKTARDLLRTIPGVGTAKPLFLNEPLPRFDSDAAVAFKLAELHRENQELQAAADSYLEAFRLSTGTLVDYPFIDFFKELGRGADLADFYTESVLRQTSRFNYVPSRLYSVLIADEATRAKAYELLKRDWQTRGDEERFRYLSGEPESFRNNPEAIFYLRSLLLPQDLSAEGSGWKFFNRFQYQGSLLVIKPLLQNKQVVRVVADEIRAGTEKYPQWCAGVATLTLLESELGNYDRSAQLIEQVLATKEQSLPFNAAKILGRSIEGQDRALDQLVIRLYEYNLANEPYENGNYASPALSLAKLYQQSNQIPESRRAILRLSSTQNQSCGAYFRESDGLSCTLCHAREKSITDYNLMTEHLTEIGYPVDALLFQSRIDTSFKNILSGSDEWSQRALPELKLKNYETLKRGFLAIKAKAVQGITPQAVMQALEEGQFLDKNSNVDLELSVRGENGLSTLSSPVIDILRRAAQSKGAAAAEGIDAVDARLVSITQANPRDVKGLVAATVFAFERNDLNAAVERLKQIQEFKDFSDDEIPNSNNLSVWFAARLALQNESTRVIGAVLAERVLTNLGDNEFVSDYRMAILRERDAIRAN